MRICTFILPVVAAILFACGGGASSPLDAIDAGTDPGQVQDHGTPDDGVGRDDGSDLAAGDVPPDAPPDEDVPDAGFDVQSADVPDVTDLPLDAAADTGSDPGPDAFEAWDAMVDVPEPAPCVACGTCAPDMPFQDLGGWCGPGDGCDPIATPDAWPNCLGMQCLGPAPGEPGICHVLPGANFGYCTARCQSDDDCRDGPGVTWVGGPSGDSFRCLGTLSFGQCFAGSLAECTDDSGCSPGESCQASYSADFQHSRGRCLADSRCGASLGETCNPDAKAGDVVACRNGWCLQGRCTRLCADEGDCDWSPELTCRMGVAVFLGEMPNDLYDICAGRGCDGDGDCGDPGLFRCNPDDPLAPDSGRGICERRTPPWPGDGA